MLDVYIPYTSTINIYGSTCICPMTQWTGKYLNMHSSSGMCMINDDQLPGAVDTVLLYIHFGWCRFADQASQSNGGK